ncbi:putative epoxide hydrolase [Exophiala viscosa]|uniref:putative epoxide hydrolase n=1 Tax=Exophiala viscosa TaxID=2486360 RepID=UPI002190580F|nr:putative epoxide hydrolase [Exophiala viscosa]
MSHPTYTSKSLTNGIHALTGGANKGTSGPIICLAGWPQTAESFAEVFPLLAQDHHVLILDPPGLGSSAPSPKDYTTKTISNILAATVSAELGDQTKYHLIAHDIGAWIAYAWACQFPKSLLSVTFIDAGIPGLLPPLEYPLPDAANLRLWQFSFNALPELPEILTAGKERQLLDWFFDLKCVHPERITRAKRDHYVASYSKPGAMTNGFNYYRAFAGSARQYVDEFSQVKIDVPVLAIGGEKAMGSAMKIVLGIAEAEVQSRSKLVIVEDCGHFVPEEQPEITAREILAFIGTCR